MRHFLVYGAHPALSQAEAAAVFGSTPSLIGSVCMASVETDAWDGSRLQDRLAGTIKLGDIVAEVPAKKLTASLLVDLLLARPRGSRVLFGLSMFADSRKERDAFQRLPILLKRELQDKGKGVRWVTGERGVIAPAAVAKLDLTEQGYDLVIGIKDNVAIIGLTTHAQDADAWSARDYGRPFRDAKTGMLPPKLARIMVNLSLAKIRPSENGDVQLGVFRERLFDPFCGSGTVLMEAALLMQNHLFNEIFAIHGSDMDAKQVRGAEQNLNWLVTKGMLSSESRSHVSVAVGDARTAHERHAAGSITSIVTEGHLGPPMRGTESLATMRKNADAVERLWREAFTSFSIIQPSRGRLVGVWPSFKTPNGLADVDLTNELSAWNYRLAQVPLPYRRPDQHVQRNIVVLEKTLTRQNTFPDRNG